MKTTHVLFNPDMALAVVGERKTQTRRIAKVERTVLGDALMGKRDSDGYARAYLLHRDADMAAALQLCPYGQPGDQLLGRETFYAWGRWETRFSQAKGRDEWHFVDDTLTSGRQYRHAAGVVDLVHTTRGGALPAWWKRPAIFMPAAASRIHLDVTGVRLERLQDISEADAIAEGIGGSYDSWRDYRTDPAVNHPSATSAVHSYATLWDSINGAGSWESNPLVWAINFKRSA